MINSVFNNIRFLDVIPKYFNLEFSIRRKKVG